MINTDPIGYSLTYALICVIIISVLSVTITMVTYPFVDPALTIFLDLFVDRGIYE